MVDPATGFFEIVEIGQKTADVIANHGTLCHQKATTHSGLHLYKTYLGTLHGGEQEAWCFLQDYLLVGSEEKAGEAC